MRFKSLALGMIIFAASTANGMAQSDQEQIQQSGAVKYVSGGVGISSAQRMAALRKQFNLELIFTIKDGHYLAMVPLTITDSHGRKVIDVESEGPLFLVNLSAGTYKISTSYAGKAQARTAKLGARSQHQIVFRWNATE